LLHSPTPSRFVATCLARTALLLGLSLAVPLPALAIGATPEDPIPFDVATGALPLSIGSGATVWVRADFVPTSSISHLSLFTEGALDTEIAVYADLGDMQRDLSLAEDDDGGTGGNASVQVPLGFPSPFLVRLAASQAGSFVLRSQLRFVPGDVCDWPAGCPLTVASQEEPTAGETLRLLRDVRDEVLSATPHGRGLSDLYWRLGRDLLPDLLSDGSLRRSAFHEISQLLPLAEEALDVSRGAGTGRAFTRGDLDRLRRLLGMISSRVSSGLTAELSARWDEFALDRHVGSPLAAVLAETGLLPASGRAHTILVKLRSEPDPEALSTGRLGIAGGALEARLAAAGAAAVRRVHAPSDARRLAGLTRTVAIEVRSLSAARDLVAELRDDPSVEWVEESAILRVLAPAGADPFRADLWGLDAVRAPQAWAITPGTCSTRVAVIDTGLRRGLADLEGRVLHHLGYDFADDDPDPHDGHGHGSHVAGTIAAALGNAVSVAGVAPGVCLFGVKVMSDDGSGTAEGVAAGIVHAADSGAEVINLSLGCDCDVQQVIEDALEYAASRDVVIVAAAGNDGTEELHYPASSPWTLAVSAVDSDLDLAGFSSYGAGIDLAAPGVDVTSLFTDGESCSGSGTSMATPHVAGVAALVRSIDPGLGREEVRSLLRAEATDLGPPGYDVRFGAGLVDALGAASTAAANHVGACTPGPSALCLAGDRFRVETLWRRSDGTSGAGRAVRLTPNTGYFWFFNETNVEMVSKVLDACSGPQPRFWVFAGGLTNVEVRLRVTDTRSGAVREYLNPQGSAFQPIQDTNAFATCQAGTASTAAPAAGLDAEAALGDLMAAAEAHAAGEAAGGAGGVLATAAAAEGGTCAESETALCLSGGRFRVETSWRRSDGASGLGRAVRLTPNTGYFWFFNASNVEMVAKVLDACGGPRRYWVFAGGLTNVSVRMRVTDTVTGAFREYVNPQGTAFKPIQDTDAFATCP
jgi:thermitase